ncbi:hypothetical protein RD110_18730 [Rhodoferax koreense]|uniref:Uncharacterized protein n=1 Tax=Rhodoferax koreensis TaxID=1842727 RepID=A0A1P8JZ11_9BURK|nr:hypothetical protein [Rhodoferax koreense]APW38990.1 hypothetical protein RD110_18730 [Rhodoferax koreense]
MQTATHPPKTARRRALTQHAALPPIAWADAAAVVLAPVPPFMADFLHHMQAELIKAAGHAPEPGSILLPPHAPLCWTHSDITSRGYDSATYATVIRYQRNFQTRMWPAWQIDEERIDAEGCIWRRERYCTVDDFGTLVPVLRGFDNDAIWGAYA